MRGMLILYNNYILTLVQIAMLAQLIGDQLTLKPKRSNLRCLWTVGAQRSFTYLKSVREVWSRNALLQCV